MDRVVPGAAHPMTLDGQRDEVFLADAGPRGIGAGVQLGLDPQSGAGPGCGNGLDDRFVAGQRATVQVMAMWENNRHLDFVPLRCAGGR